MYARIVREPLDRGHSFFLFGPRGTGKTTWLRARCPSALYLDLLAGSSARSLRRRGVNLLAGRAHTYHMYPLVAAELGRDFALERSLRFGHLPQVYREPNPEKYLAACVQTYLREEVLQEGLTRNLAAFGRFLEMASFSQASVLNVAETARDAGLERRTVANYFDLLEDLLLSVRVAPFARRARRRLVAHPKFYFFDVGVYRQLRPQGPLDSPAEAEGPALESLVFQELRAVSEYVGLGYSFYYWRTAAGAEVDLVAYGPRGLLAFEIKRSSRVSRRDAAALTLFKGDYPEARCFLLYGGDKRLYWPDVEVWPVEEALRELPRLITPE